MLTCANTTLAISQQSVCGTCVLCMCQTLASRASEDALREYAAISKPAEFRVINGMEL